MEINCLCDMVSLILFTLYFFSFTSVSNLWFTYLSIYHI